MKEQLAETVAIGETTTLNEAIIDAIQDVKGKNITELNLKNLDDATAEYFIVCEGESTTQVNAISRKVIKEVEEMTGERPFHVEGTSEAKWILIDYFNVVVHIFYPETRSFYDIEDLWGDAKITEYKNI